MASQRSEHSLSAPLSDNVGSTRQNSPSCQRKERALLYIDNSNIFISAQKHSALLRGFREGIYDTTCRINMQKLYRLALNNRPQIAKGKLFGSPVAVSRLESVWETYSTYISVFLSERNVKAKEKIVDTKLVALAVEDLIQHGNKSEGEPTEEEEQEDPWGTGTTAWTNVFILFSGDADMKPVVQMALKYKWKVEIWSFKGTTAECLKNLERDNENNVTLKFIDAPLTTTDSANTDNSNTKNSGSGGQGGQVKIFDEICFYENEWKKENDEKRMDRSLLLKFNPSACLSGNEEVTRRKNLVNKAVKESTELFKLPTQAYIYNCNVPTEIVVVCGPPEHADKNQPPLYNFNEHVWSKRRKLVAALKEDGCEEIMAFQEFVQKELEEKSQKSAKDQNSRQIKKEVSCPAKGFSLLPDGDPGEKLPGVGYKVVKHKKRRPGIQGVSGENCKYNFTCTKFPNCVNVHTEQQKEYFKEHPLFTKLDRRSYKTTLCSNEPKGQCKYQSKSWLCRFAHSKNEGRCKNCNITGHFQSSCPKPPRFK